MANPEPWDQQVLMYNPWPEEKDVEAGQTAAVERKREALRHLKLVTAFVGGVVPLIMLPGIIVAVRAEETMTGIAVSSAITAVVNLFAGLFYYLNKRV